MEFSSLYYLSKTSDHNGDGHSGEDEEVTAITAELLSQKSPGDSGNSTEVSPVGSQNRDSDIAADDEEEEEEEEGEIEDVGMGPHQGTVKACIKL